jgi:hypothetical protein
MRSDQYDTIRQKKSLDIIRIRMWLLILYHYTLKISPEFNLEIF